MKLKEKYSKQESTSPRNPKKILKKDNNFEEYLRKFFEDEPNLKKKVYSKNQIKQIIKIGDQHF